MINNSEKRRKFFGEALTVLLVTIVLGVTLLLFGPNIANGIDQVLVVFGLGV
jgi:hypothetical protein